MSPSCMMVTDESKDNMNVKQDFYSSKRGHITGSQLKKIKNCDAPTEGLIDFSKDKFGGGDHSEKEIENFRANKNSSQVEIDDDF